MAGPVHTKQILLADDDKDDVLLFNEAIEQLMLSGNITAVYDGEKLMQLLNDGNSLPDILFLDLNMPRKNGLDCLSEIKHSSKLRSLPVIIISTSHEINVVNQLYDGGAQYYICKPTDFTALKRVLDKVIRLADAINLSQPPRDKFVLTHNLKIDDTNERQTDYTFQ